MPDWIQTAADPTSRRWIEKSDGEKSSSSSSISISWATFQSSLEYHSLSGPIHSFVVVVSITEQCLPKASSTPRVKQFKTRHFKIFIQNLIHSQNKAPHYHKAPYMIFVIFWLNFPPPKITFLHQNRQFLPLKRTIFGFILKFLHMYCLWCLVWYLSHKSLSSKPKSWWWRGVVCCVVSEELDHLVRLDHVSLIAFPSLRFILLPKKRERLQQISSESVWEIVSVLHCTMSPLSTRMLL